MTERNYARPAGVTAETWRALLKEASRDAIVHGCLTMYELGEWPAAEMLAQIALKQTEAKREITAHALTLAENTAFTNLVVPR